MIRLLLLCKHLWIAAPLCAFFFLSGCAESPVKDNPPQKQVSTPWQPEVNLNPNLTGRWINQRGSIIEFYEGKHHVLTGTFTTAVAKTKTCIGYPAPLTGYRNGNAIALSLNMEGCQSPVVIAMTGSVHFNPQGKEEIHMLGVTQYKGKELWNSRIITNDVYTRLE